MATDENNHKNEARDDWTGCTFRVERGPSSEGRAWGMADILTDACGGATFRPRHSPRRPHRRDRDPWTSSFVLFFPAGSTPLRVRTVFFKAVMFLLHYLPPHRSSYYPACRFLFSPSAHKEL